MSNAGCFGGVVGSGGCGGACIFHDAISLVAYVAACMQNWGGYSIYDVGRNVSYPNIKVRAFLTVMQQHNNTARPHTATMMLI